MAKRTIGGGLLGATIGGFTVGGPVGAIIGGILGATVGNKLEPRYTTVREHIRRIR